MQILKKFWHPTSLAVIGVIIGILFYKYPAPHSRILNIQNYLITVGGILSAFVISYLAAKLFNIQSEREQRQKEIVVYSEQLTAFRRILYYTMKSYKFGERYDDIKKFKIKYPTLNYQRLRSHSDEDPERRQFWLEEAEICQNTISLFAAIEEIYGNDGTDVSDWIFDRAIKFNYSLEQIERFYEPSNQIWYYLDGRYGKNGAGKFNDTGLNLLYLNGYNEFVSKTDAKYRGKDFHRLILAEIGTEMYEITLPKLHKLISLNSNIPKSLFGTFRNLIYITIFGVLLPIVIQSINIEAKLDTFLTLTCVLLTTVSIINFILEFYLLLENEVYVDKNIS